MKLNNPMYALRWFLLIFLLVPCSWSYVWYGRLLDLFLSFWIGTNWKKWDAGFKVPLDRKTQSWQIDWKFWKLGVETPSYHDLYVTLPGIERTSIFDLPYSVHVTCTRTGGWEVWDTRSTIVRSNWTLLGSEYGADFPLRLDVNGRVVVDSFKDKR